MKKINILDSSMINKIAAGEVVERPASIIKELSENSIDAGATDITIEIKDGGISYIRISDNGCGIDEEDIENAFLRHATSKIRNMDDLINVLTLGFRGEALSSISAISNVELITKTKEAIKGTRLVVEAESILSKNDVGSANGTSIVVSNMFFNVPARRKFLKKPAIESGYISDLINKFALGNPNVSFKFINNGNTLLSTSGNGNLSNTILQVYGKEVAKNILEVHASSDGVTIDGYIGKPELARSNRKYETLFLNGRYIQSDLVSKAVGEAYKTKLPIGKFPLYVLNISLEPDKVDVNVHPNKLQVRFSNEDFLFNFIEDAIYKALSEEILIPQETILTKEEIKESIVQDNTIQEPKPEFKIEMLEEQKKEHPKVYDIGQPTSSVTFKEPTTVNTIITKSIPEKTIIPEPSIIFKKQEIINQETFFEKKKTLFEDAKIIGQLFNTYWIIEKDNKMYLIDQHAAHERILYEEIKEKLKRSKLYSIKLLTPIVIDLSLSEQEVLKTNQKLIDDFGYSLEEFGNNTFAIREVPYIFDKPENAQFFLEIIDMLSDYKSEDVDIYDLKLDKIASMSCKAAVKGKDRLTELDSKKIIEKFLTTIDVFTCPHGRPTIIEISKYEIEKKFKRIQ